MAAGSHAGTMHSGSVSHVDTMHGSHAGSMTYMQGYNLYDHDHGIPACVDFGMWGLRLRVTVQAG